jgi:hypothetical protein
MSNAYAIMLRKWTTNHEGYLVPDYDGGTLLCVCDTVREAKIIQDGHTVKMIKSGCRAYAAWDKALFKKNFLQYCTEKAPNLLPYMADQKGKDTAWDRFCENGFYLMNREIVDCCSKIGLEFNFMVELRKRNLPHYGKTILVETAFSYESEDDDYIKDLVEMSPVLEETDASCTCENCGYNNIVKVSTCRLCNTEME